MSIHLQREIEKLKKHLLSLCAVVEDQVQMAIEAFLQRDENVGLGSRAARQRTSTSARSRSRRNASRCSPCTSPWRPTCG